MLLVPTGAEDIGVIVETARLAGVKAAGAVPEHRCRRAARRRRERPAAHRRAAVVQHGVAHRDLDVLAFAGRNALEQGGDNPHCRQHACAGVTDGGAWTDRRFIRHAIDSHGSAGRLCDHVEGKVVRIFTIRREPFHLREDDPRIDFLQARPVETEPGKCTGCHVLDDDVRLVQAFASKAPYQHPS